MSFDEILKVDGMGRGAITILYAVVGAVAAFTDYRSGKIYNWLTFPAMAGGLALAAFGGSVFFLSGLMGLLIALLLFLPLNATGVIGAGDAKLVMAYATVLGVMGALNLIFYSFLVAGIGSVIILLVRGRGGIFITEFILFIKSIITPGLALHWPKLDRQSRAPFGIAIFAAYIITEAVR